MKMPAAFSEYAIPSLGNQLSLQFRNLYYGINPGKWKSCLPHNRLICVLKSDGESSFTDAGGAIPLLPGSIVLVPAFHEILHEQNASMVHLSIHFNIELYCQIDLLAQCEKCWSKTDVPQIEKIVQVFAAPDRMRITLMMFSLCWNSLAEFLNPRPPSVEKLFHGCSYYAPLFSYFSSHCHFGIDVSAMARVMRMNPETFSKKFFYDTGIPPKRFFNRLLLSRAVRIILGSNLTIREIASELQFCDEYYFSKFFKRHLGISPRIYRKIYSLSHESKSSVDQMMLIAPTV